jgi:polysaccharide pyruvyl transferase CsaB
LQDSTSLRSLLYYGALIVAARLQGRPVFLWAQGLGPLRRLRSRLLVRWLLPMATAITWRDAGSARLARGLGCVAPHGADAVWALPPLPWLGRGGPIVVCWRPTCLLTPQSWSVLLEALSQLAEAHDRQVLWLPFHRSQDDPLLQWLQQQGLMPPALLRRSRQLEAQLPSEAMAVFRSAGLVVAMRLHALILAALSGSPVAALSYDPKVQACASEFGCGCTDLADVLPSPDQLSAAWADALDQPTSADALRQMQQATAVHQALLQRLGA